LVCGLGHARPTFQAINAVSILPAAQERMRRIRHRTLTSNRTAAPCSKH
jgi:hypothetical protein